jgi:hypothetical protein
VRVAVCCTEPAVAVTVTADVDEVDIGEDGPPHPVTHIRAKVTTAKTRNICIQRRLLQPKQQRPAASVTLGKNGPGLRRNSAVAALVTMVRVAAAVVPAGVTLAGEKLHDAPDGSPEQMNVTSESNPFSGVIETVVVPLDPDATVMAVGESEMLKSGAARLIV